MVHLILLLILLDQVNTLGQPCSTDADCPYEGEFRCCPIQGSAENCPKHSSMTIETNDITPGNCVLPGASGNSTCACSLPNTCGNSSAYPSPVAGMKQYLMLGDSISGGIHGSQGFVQNLTSNGVQTVHLNHINGANVWWGAHCLDEWLGPDPSRWDIISFNFGLHDLALDIERLETPFYAHWLRNITHRLIKSSRAQLIWVTSTPVPLGLNLPCNKSTGQGGCPPRTPGDSAIYNAAAAKVIDSFLPNKRISTLDLYSVVTKRCGSSYTFCPSNCNDYPGHPGNVTCFNRPYNVHYNRPGWLVLASANIEAVLSVM